MTDETETPAAPGNFIVIHINKAGHQFATRAPGADHESAAKTILAAHEDNRFIHVYEDTGQSTVDSIGIRDEDGKPVQLEVKNLSDEP